MSDARRRVGDGSRRDRVAQRIAIVASLAATGAVALPMTLSAIQVDRPEFSAEAIAMADPRFPAPMATLGGDVELALDATPTPTPQPRATSVEIAIPGQPTPAAVATSGDEPTAGGEPTPAAPVTPFDPTTPPVTNTPRSTSSPTIPTPIVLPPLPPTPPPSETPPITTTPTERPTETATPTATISAPSPVTPTPDALEGSLHLVSATPIVVGTDATLTIGTIADGLDSGADVTVRISVDGAALVDTTAIGRGWSCANVGIGSACRADQVTGSAEGSFRLTVRATQSGPVAIIVVIEATKDGSTLRWGGAAALTAEPAPEPSYTPESDPRPDPRAAELTTP